MIIWADIPTGDVGMYGTDGAKLLDGLYAAFSGTLVADPYAPATPGIVMKFNQLQEARFVLPANKPTVGVALRYWPNGFSAVTHRIVNFRNSGNVDHVRIAIDVNGYLIVQNGTGTTLFTSSGPVATANSWQHFEVKVTIDSLVGAVKVRREGITICDISGVNTRNSAIDSSVYSVAMSYPSSGGSVSMHIKDFVVWDNTGSRNNDFLGSVQVIRLKPDSDIAMAWNKSSGAVGWDLLNDAPPVDTNYIAAIASPIPAAAEMTLTDLPANVTSVKAVLPITRSTKTDGGDGSLQAGIKSSGSTGSGANRPITTAFTYYWDVQETDPATGTDWTPAAVNAARIVINRTV